MTKLSELDTASGQIVMFGSTARIRAIDRRVSLWGSEVEAKI